MKYEELVDMDFPGGTFHSGQLMAGKHSPAGVRRQLDRWVKTGRILRLRRGVYMLSKPPGGRAHPFLAANRLAIPSYVSLQSALAYYGMIPEYVPVTTSITTERPEELETAVGRFLFRHVASRLFFGFRELEVSWNQRVLIATPQKALLDLFYLTPDSDNPDYLRELRLDLPEDFSLENLKSTAAESGSKKLMRAVREIFLFRQKGEL